MNTKPIPAVLALIAGFVTCVISFVQHVDTVVFARKFVLVCIVFFAIGMVIHLLIQMNFKETISEDETPKEEEVSGSEDEDSQDGQENVQEADEDEE